MGTPLSELCNIEVADVDLENCKIRINQGKCSKDRCVLFSKGFATALRTHIAALGLLNVIRQRVIESVF